MSSFQYTCSECGETHEGVPSIYFDKPFYYFEVEEADQHLTEVREGGCSVVLDGERHYFVHCLLELHIHEMDEPLEIVMWMSLSAPNYEKFYALKGQEIGEDVAPMVGWLSSRIPTFEGMEELVGRIWLQDGDALPILELQPTDHPLSVCAQEGISKEQVVEILSVLGHGKD